MNLTYISLLRGINVSGQKKVPMAELREVYASLGLAPVQTYIQSGNVIFQSAETNKAALRDQLEKAIQQKFGFEVVVILRTLDEWQEVASHALFSSGDETTNHLYVTFLAETPDAERVEALTLPTDNGDEFQVTHKEVYVLCPNGYGRTKLTNTFFERKLKVQATTRNAKSVRKLQVLAENLA
uniref:DUF1697 domain-containing protein n=1 Tax=Roseihalotalea indica TaxID=2867963 RepID=A0AA49JEL3_9BACT|nr:DUF1697 domain-containing protein [Tunicatimonas sp. TK19036]